LLSVTLTKFFKNFQLFHESMVTTKVPHISLQYLAWFTFKQQLPSLGIKSRSMWVFSQIIELFFTLGQTAVTQPWHKVSVNEGVFTNY